MADKIKEVAIEEADRIKSLASDAARSGAYLYPIRVSTYERFTACHRHAISRYDSNCRQCPAALPCILLLSHSLTFLRTGNSLLHFPPLVMETSHLQTGSDDQFGSRRHDLHVCLYLPAADGSHGIYKRASCCSHCRCACA